MRVVAGELRGRRLHAPPGRGTRPTADRVREALFQILGDLGGASVLDLFAGSGALGIEALSRGAASAVFVDSDPRAVATVRRNIEELGLEAPVKRADALAFLRRRDPPGAPYDVVFLDPPYSSGPRLGGQLSELLRPVVLETSLIVSESNRRNPLELAFPLADERVYGDTRIAIHRVR